MKEIITFELSENDNINIEKVLEHIKGNKYEGFLIECFTTIINIEGKMFEYDSLILDRLIKSFINLRRETYNNPRVLKLRDNGVDVNAQLVVTIATSFKEFLYTEETNKDIDV